VLPRTQMRWVTFDCVGTLVSDEAWPTIRAFDDVEPLLAELRRRGYRIGVLTNCTDEQFEKTHRTFERPFDFFVTSDRIQGHKPEPWHFRGFRLLTGVLCEDWVHVSSDWQKDIVPAQSLGIRRVWFDRRGTGEDPARASAHVRTAHDAVQAVDWLLQRREARAS